MSTADSTQLEQMRQAANERGVSDEVMYILCDAMVRAAGGRKPYVSPADLVRTVGEIAEELCPGGAEALLAKLGIRSSLDVGRIIQVMIDVGVSRAAEGESVESYRDLPLFPQGAPAHEIFRARARRR